MSKTYEIRNRKTNRRGYVSVVVWHTPPKYRCGEGEDLFGFCSEDYSTLKEASKDWIIPKNIQRRLWLRANWARFAWGGAFILGGIIGVALAVGVFVLFTHTWDYRTGQDTGYISAVDKMTFSDDHSIFIRRRPLDATGYGYAEKDEAEYCTTAEYQDVIDKAYEAMANGKRVILIYDKPRPFGWRAIGHCNSAPITDIKYVEEK